MILNLTASNKIYLNLNLNYTRVYNAPVNNTPSPPSPPHYYRNPTPVLYRGIDRSFSPRVGEIDMGY